MQERYPAQAWFWTREWYDSERQVDEDIAAGRRARVPWTSRTQRDATMSTATLSRFQRTSSPTASISCNASSPNTGMTSIVRQTTRYGIAWPPQPVMRSPAC